MWVEAASLSSMVAEIQVRKPDGLGCRNCNDGNGNWAAGDGDLILMLNDCSLSDLILGVRKI